MNIWKKTIIIVGLIFILGLFAWFYEQLDLEYWLKKTLLSKTEERYCIERDLDGDNFKEKIRFTERKIFDRDYYGEIRIEVSNKNNDIWCSDFFIGNIDLVNFHDINKDGKKEIICRFLDGNAVDLEVYEWNGRSCEEIFSGGGKDVKLADIDHDGIEEIFEYFRDYDQPYGNYFASLHRWNGKVYGMVKEYLPLKLDPLRGDRLILGKNKVVVLK